MANGLFAGGDGSANNPYLIEDAHDLDAIRNGLDKHYRLINDIDLNIEPYNEGGGWNPIGSLQIPFAGSFNGDGHKIENLYINRPNGSYQGLFSTIINSSLKNITLEKVNITSRSNIGSLVGITRGSSTIENVSSTGTVRVSTISGGLIGRVDWREEDEVYIKSLKFDGEIIGGSEDGGEVSYIGGIIGILKGNIENSYFTGKITFKNNVLRCGGIVGNVYPDSKIKNTYASNKFDISVVETITQLGGVFGYLSNATTSVVTNSFWNIETSGITTPAVGSTGLTTQQMKAVQTFIDAGWDKELNDEGNPIWILKDGEYSKLWFEQETKPNLYLFQCGNSIITTKKDGSLEKVGEIPVTKEMFDEYGIEYLPNTIGQISNEEPKKLLINSIIEPKINITSIPKPQMIFPTGDIIIPSGANLLNVAVDGKSNNDLVKMIFSIDSGNTWLTIDESNNIIQIDHNNLGDVKNKGMTLSMINNVGSIWSNLVSDKIRFAYYLEIESLDDEEYLDNLDITLYVPAKWEAIDEYRYGYGNEKIHVRLYKDGSYKINYTE